MATDVFSVPPCRGTLALCLNADNCFEIVETQLLGDIAESLYELKANGLLPGLERGIEDELEARALGEDRDLAVLEQAKVLS